MVQERGGARAWAQCGSRWRCPLRTTCRRCRSWGRTQRLDSGGRAMASPPAAVQVSPHPSPSPPNSQLRLGYRLPWCGGCWGAFYWHLARKELDASLCMSVCVLVRGEVLSLRPPEPPPTADSNVWVAMAQLPQGLDLEYKFVVWKAAMRDAAGERNRRLHIPADGGKLQASPSCLPPSKHFLPLFPSPPQTRARKPAGVGAV